MEKTAQLPFRTSFMPLDLATMMPSTLFTALDAATIAVTALVCYTAIPTWRLLPSNAKVPMQFGFKGEVNWSIENKHAYLLYPVIAIGCVIFATLFLNNSKMNHGVAVTKENEPTLRLLGLYVVRVTTFTTCLMVWRIVVECPNLDGTLGGIAASTVQSYLAALATHMAYHFFTIYVVVPVACADSEKEHESR